MEELENDRLKNIKFNVPFYKRNTIVVYNKDLIDKARSKNKCDDDKQFQRRGRTS